MVEEKVYYRYVGEHSQRQGHLGESRVNMTLSHVRRRVRREGGRGERRRGGGERVRGGGERG